MTGFSSGTHILAQCDLGAFAEHALAPAHSVRPVPRGWTTTRPRRFHWYIRRRTSASFIAGSFKKGRVCSSIRPPAASGWPPCKSQAAFGAGKIIGTVGSDEKREAVLAAGRQKTWC